jgi:hypothetical protein
VDLEEDGAQFLGCGERDDIGLGLEYLLEEGGVLDGTPQLVEELCNSPIHGNLGVPEPEVLVHLGHQ